MGSSVLRPVALLGWSLAQVKLTMVGLACALILALPLIHGVYPLSVAMVFLALYGAPLLLYLPACRSVGGAIAIGLGYAICAGASAAYLAWIVVHPIEPGQATIGAGFTPLVCGGLQALALWSGMAAALAVERVACRFRQPRDPVARAEKPTRDMPPAKDLRPAPTKTVKQTPPASLEVTDFASRWITVPIGIALGGLFAAIAGTVLAVALLLPPLCYWFDFRGEFSILLLMVLPILAFVSGAIGGAIAGCLPRARIAIPLTASAAPIAISLWFTDGLSQFVGFFLALLGATAISLRLITAVFRAIDRHQMRRKQTGVAIG